MRMGDELVGGIEHHLDHAFTTSRPDIAPGVRFSKERELRENMVERSRAMARCKRPAYCCRVPCHDSGMARTRVSISDCVPPANGAQPHWRRSYLQLRGSGFPRYGFAPVLCERLHGSTVSRWVGELSGLALYIRAVLVANDAESAAAVAWSDAGRYGGLIVWV